jgi:hypothetical protein
VVAGEKRSSRPWRHYAGRVVANDPAPSSILLREKAPAAPTTKDFTNMFLSGHTLATILGESIKIETK